MASVPSGLRALHLVKTSVGAVWAFRQMRELVKMGVEVHVALPPGGDLLTQYEQAGIIVHPVSLDFPVRKPWRWPELIRQIRKLVFTVCPDIIHSHSVGTTVTMRLGLGRRARIPRIFQVPGPLHLEHPFFRWAEILLADEFDYWIGSCKYTCDLYTRFGLPRDRIFMSYYGVDLGRFEDRRPGKLKAELKVDVDTKLVGMVAYIYAPKRFLGQTRGIKGHEDLIDAIAICLGRERSLKLKGVFVGGAWDKATAYEKRVREYGRNRCGDHIVFLGTRNDVPELYPDFDVAVHPSHSENIGGAVESLLLAVPTIATCTGGFPEIVIPGTTGWLVPPKRPDCLADVLLEALRDPGRGLEMARRGQRLARQWFDVRKTAREVADIYEQVLTRALVSGPRTHGEGT